MVVAAVLADDLVRPRRVLAARRSSPPALAGRWEFPGGKVKPGEDPLEALHRELREELEVEIAVGPELLNPAGGAWPISPAYELRLWLGSIRRGEPRVTGGHDELRWLNREELFDVAWLEPDLPIVRALAPMLVGGP